MHTKIHIQDINMKRFEHDVYFQNNESRFLHNSSCKTLAKDTAPAPVIG